MKVKVLNARCEDVGVDAAEIDHVFRRIERGRDVAAIPKGEIGENVGALTAKQKLLAVTTDKIRFAGARTQVLRHHAVADRRDRPRPGASQPAVHGPYIRGWKSGSDIGREGVGGISGSREIDGRVPGHGRHIFCAREILAVPSEPKVIVSYRNIADRVIRVRSCEFEVKSSANQIISRNSHTVSIVPALVRNPQRGVGIASLSSV